MPSIPGFPAPIKALAVVPFGMEEGTDIRIPGREFGLVVGQPAEFRFFTSATRKNDEPGELIEVTAGIVSTTSSLKTEVIVGGKKVQVDEYGLAAYKFQASTQAGKHTVPVTLKFIDQEGKEQYITKNVEYAISGNK